MEKDTSQNQVKLICSVKKENLETQNKVIELAKKFIKSLNLSEVDEITEWMIFYLSELIESIDETNEEEAINNKKICFDTILKIWKHKSYLPNEVRPFVEYEEVFRALKSLDPENKYPRYYTEPNTDKPQLTDKGTTWLEFVDRLDNVTRILISFALKEAYDIEHDEKSLDYINSLKESVDCIETGLVYQIFKNNIDIEDGDAINDERVKLLKERELQLKAFEEISSNIREEIKMKIETLENN